MKIDVKGLAKAVIPVAAVVLTAVSSLMGKAEQKELIAKEVEKALADRQN